MLLYNSVEFELAPADVLIYAPRNNPEVKMAIENRTNNLMFHSILPCA